MIRDANLTRRLTDEEMEQNIEVLDCADRTCSNERRALGDEEDFIVIPGAGPQITPLQVLTAFLAVLLEPRL